MKNNHEELPKQNLHFKKRLLIILLIIFFMIPFIWYQNNHLVISQYYVSNDKIPIEFKGYKILQISDLHNANFGRKNDKLIDKIINENPDIIVLTGDIIDSNHYNFDIAIDFCKSITSVCPVYFITGNHEYWLSSSDKETLFNSMIQAGVRILKNESVLLQRGNSEISLTGLDERNLFDDTVVDLLESNKYNIVLAHEPQYLNKYSLAGVDLVLAGHAHGGQIILPFIGPLVAPDQGFMPDFTEGEYAEDNTLMIVSRGLGNSIIPFRLFNYPEIVEVVF